MTGEGEGEGSDKRESVGKRGPCTYAFMDHMTIRGRWSVVGGGVVLERKDDGQGEELAM